MFQHIFAASEGRVIDRFLKAHMECSGNGGNINVVVIEKRKGAAFPETGNRLGHQRRILPCIKPQGKLRLVQAERAAGLQRKHRKPVSHSRIRAAHAANEDPVVELVGIGMHQLPQRFDERQCFRFIQNSRIEIARQKRPEIHIHAAVVPCARQQRVNPKKLHCLAEVCGRMMRQSRQRFGKVAQLLFTCRIRRVRSFHLRLGAIVQASLFHQPNCSQHATQKTGLCFAYGGLRAPLLQFAPQARNPRLQQGAVVEHRSRHPVEWKSDSALLCPVVAGQRLCDRKRISGPCSCLRIFALPEREHLFHFARLFGRECSQARGLPHFSFAAVIAQSHRFRAEAHQRIRNSARQQIARLHGLEDRWKEHLQALQLSRRRIGCPVLFVSARELELQRQRIPGPPAGLAVCGLNRDFIQRFH